MTAWRRLVESVRRRTVWLNTDDPGVLRLRIGVGAELLVTELALSGTHSREAIVAYLYQRLAQQLLAELGLDVRDLVGTGQHEQALGHLMSPGERAQAAGQAQHDLAAAGFCPNCLRLLGPGHACVRPEGDAPPRTLRASMVERAQAALGVARQLVRGIEQPEAPPALDEPSERGLPVYRPR